MTVSRDILKKQIAVIVKALDDARIAHALKAGTADFHAGIRAGIRGLWLGELTRFGFIETMEASIRRGFRAAWLEGAATCGISARELTSAERAAIEQAVNAQLPHLPGFADTIEAGSKENDGKLQPLFSRGELWANRFLEVRTQAQLSACADKKFEWEWDSKKEHCIDCAAQNGRVHRGSVWAAANVRPQSANLACQGFDCGCRLVPTTRRASPGRPPRLSGG